MKPNELLDILQVAHCLKITLRHCFMENNRQESVAEHSWRVALMAMLIGDDMDFDTSKVIEMSLIHDLGEVFTGDIPTFKKKRTDRSIENEQYDRWVRSFPSPQKEHFESLLKEMEEQESIESRVFKALDKLEAVISHNESDLSTWLPLEYDLQYTYGKEQVEFSEYLKALKDQIDTWTTNKIKGM